MTENIISSKSFFVVGLKYALEKFPDFIITEVFRDWFEFAWLDLAEQVIFKFSEEWQFAYKHYVQTDAKRPHISRGRAVWSTAGEIRVHVMRSTTNRAVKLFGWFDWDWEPKVDDFDLLWFLFIQDVVQFKVSMRFASVVHVADAEG